jgi:PleD family two-component response regulator
MNDNSILLFDPFENVLTVYRTILEEAGFQVNTAPDLTKSANFFSIKHCPIVIIEYVISFEDTVQFIQWVKKTSPATYIILNSSIAIDDQTYGKFFEMGLDDYLLKPYAPEKLLLHIRKGLKQIKLVMESREREKQSFFDPMAQKVQQEIFNPPYFKRELRRELTKANRHQQPMSLLLLKLPSQEVMGKRFEPFYGKLINILKGTLREEDIVGRENGKLGILLSQTDQTGSQTLGQRLSNKIKSHPSFESDHFFKPIINEIGRAHV